MVYIHIPFCGSFCTYCGFYSEVAAGDFFDGYVRALCAEIRSRAGETVSDPYTLYIGGGTPSLLSADAIGRIATEVRHAGGDVHGAGFREFTLEANPEDIVSKSRGYAESLAAAGVNRISMGVQSFDDSVLTWMNRRHDAATAENALRILREAGFGNISIDLIFGISYLDDRLWRQTVHKAVSLHPQHISAYQLSVEPGSTLESLVRKGKYTEADERQCRRQYEILCGILSEAGYHHYEISNFALPGYEAVHNSAYWHHVPYAGFGPGAHSLRITAGDTGGMEPVYVRSWNLPDWKKYVEFYSGRIPADGISGSETLSEEQVAIERIMLGLRTDRGVELTCLEQHSDMSRLGTMLDKGILVPAEKPGFVRIPEPMFFISDSIIADLV